MKHRNKIMTALKSFFFEQIIALYGCPAALKRVVDKIFAFMDIQNSIVGFHLNQLRIVVGRLESHTLISQVFSSFSVRVELNHSTVIEIL